MSLSHGKVVLITGGAGGIGAAIARRFGKQGTHIALVDLDEQQLRNQVQSLTEMGISAKAWTVDVTDHPSATQVIQQITEHFGSLDVLVLSAGLTQVSLFQDTQVDVIRRVMEVNFFGAVNFAQASLPALIASHGRIVVLSSIAGFAPLIGRTGYCASKHALHGFFDTLRAELTNQSVSVTIVCPSFVATEFATKGLQGDGSKINFDRSTTGRMLQPDQVADAVFHACQKRRPLVVLPSLGKVAYWISRVAPSWYQHMMSKRFSQEFERQHSRTS
jgi:NADP-dependent 3-hydroxy acid dehydrogenase YdfG